MVDDDDDDSYDSSHSTQTAARRKQKNQYSGMVQWASPEYEHEIITSLEDTWMEIQALWIGMYEMRSEIEDP